MKTKNNKIRKAYGRFWFRFMNGESGADVYDRATAFWESVFRSMDNTNSDIRFRNYVIITHGLMMVSFSSPRHLFRPSVWISPKRYIA